MATRLFDAISTRGTHEIGSLNTKWAKPVVNGALAVEDIENYTVVELYYENNVLKAKQLDAVANEGYLVTTIEEEQLLEGEEYLDFYNANGEIIGLTRFEKGVRFETSAFSKNTGVTTMSRGMVAHFDPATKKYIVSAAGTPHADYATAYDKFTLVDEDSEFGYAFDKVTIRLERK